MVLVSTYFIINVYPNIIVVFAKYIVRGGGLILPDTFEAFILSSKEGLRHTQT